MENSNGDVVASDQVTTVAWAEGLSEDATLELRPERQQEASEVAVWQRALQAGTTTHAEALWQDRAWSS